MSTTATSTQAMLNQAAATMLEDQSFPSQLGLYSIFPSSMSSLTSCSSSSSPSHHCHHPTPAPSASEEEERNRHRRRPRRGRRAGTAIDGGLNTTTPATSSPATRVRRHPDLQPLLVHLFLVGCHHHTLPPPSLPLSTELHHHCLTARCCRFTSCCTGPSHPSPVVADQQTDFIGRIDIFLSGQKFPQQRRNGLPATPTTTRPRQGPEGEDLRALQIQMHQRRHTEPWKLLKQDRGAANQDQAWRKRVCVCPEPSCLYHDPCHVLDNLVGIKKHSAGSTAATSNGSVSGAPRVTPSSPTTRPTSRPAAIGVSSARRDGKLDTDVKMSAGGVLDRGEEDSGRPFDGCEGERT